MTDFVTGLSDEPMSLAMDEGSHEFLYWSMKDGKIQRTELYDGQNHIKTVYDDESLSEITGLSVGFSRDPPRIFFCDPGNERSFYKDKTGQAVELTEYITDQDISDEKEREKLRDIQYFNGNLYWAKEDDPPGIAIMTNYDQNNRSFQLKTIPKIGKLFQLVITN
nr:uncharacterized protein LOC129269601 [Lytechinus pictus]